MLIRGAFDKFPAFFFVEAFKIVVDSWKFSMLLLYILWDNWPIFMISGSKEQLQQQLEYTLLKPGQCTSPQTPSLSQIIWPRWAPRQFLTLPIVRTLFPVIFGYSLSSEAIEEMKAGVMKVTDMLTQEDLHGAFQKLLEWYNKCIAARGDYFEGD